MTDREVLAFDLYGTLVDPMAISTELGRVLGGSDDREAAKLWRLKQLEYSFRLTAMSRYEDFRWVTYDHLQPFPDAVPALRALAGMGYELAVFANGTPAMIENCLENSGLAGFFGQQISVDGVRALLT